MRTKNKVFADTLSVWWLEFLTMLIPWFFLIFRSSFPDEESKFPPSWPGFYWRKRCNGVPNMNMIFFIFWPIPIFKCLIPKAFLMLYDLVDEKFSILLKIWRLRCNNINSNNKRCLKNPNQNLLLCTNKLSITFVNIWQMTAV